MAELAKIDDSTLTKETVEIDGKSLEVLHNPEMTEWEWEDYKRYLEANPDEALRLIEESTNPDCIRKQRTMTAIADVWRKVMDDDSDEFSKKIKALEEDPEFAAMFADLKAYRWDDVNKHLDSSDLMMKVSRRMGGVPRDAKQKADKIRKTPITLQEACKFGDIKALQNYLSETEGMSRDIDAKDHKGITCLGYAVGANRLNVTKLLMECKADATKVDGQGNTALHYAAAYGRKDLADYLIGAGLQVNAKNSVGLTPLAVASRNKQKVAVTFLTEKGGVEE